MGISAELAEAVVEHGNHHDPAAHAEQNREHAGDEAGGDQRGAEQRELRRSERQAGRASRAVEGSEGSCVSLRSPVCRSSTPARALAAASALLAALFAAGALARAGEAEQRAPIAVGVSWSHFQEERWKIDEA